MLHHRNTNRFFFLLLNAASSNSKATVARLAPSINATMPAIATPAMDLGSANPPAMGIVKLSDDIDGNRDESSIENERDGVVIISIRTDVGVRNNSDVGWIRGGENDVKLGIRSSI